MKEKNINIGIEEKNNKFLLFNSSTLNHDDQFNGTVMYIMNNFRDNVVHVIFTENLQDNILYNYPSWQSDRIDYFIDDLSRIYHTRQVTLS